MPISLFELFSIGIGPSSSHTLGPMRAARQFALKLEAKKLLDRIDTLNIDLFGSLAMTGVGHGTDKALLLGLQGYTPEGIDPSAVPGILSYISRTCVLNMLGRHPFSFIPEEHLIFNKGKRLPFHSNAMRFTTFDSSGEELSSQIYYSTGGGFIIEHERIHDPAANEEERKVPYPYDTCEQLLAHCKEQKMMIYDLVMENEKAHKPEEAVKEGVLYIWHVMQSCVNRGLHQSGELPGGLNVKRRASTLYRKLLKKEEEGEKDHSDFLDWVNVFALAANEENAAGGRVVTAPTNGAAGVMPAVLSYYKKFILTASDEGVIKFFAAASAIAILFKKGASLSAAEVGCQGEVGVACAMSAAGLTAALGGTNEQIENAAEIGMEHNLGLTCDPIAGLVQIPCIERNTMGAVQAINASKLALNGDGSHRVSLDQVIQTMRRTGEDMKNAYKETSEGGLALHVPVSSCEC